MFLIIQPPQLTVHVIYNYVRVNKFVPLTVKGGAWMGLNDCLYPNKHRWSWGFSQKRCHKFDWYGSEPVYHASGDWNCGAFWETYQYHWHVDSCVQRNYYVCEMAQVWMFYSIYRNLKVLFFLLYQQRCYHNIYGFIKF